MAKRTFRLDHLPELVHRRPDPHNSHNQNDESMVFAGINRPASSLKTQIQRPELFKIRSVRYRESSVSGPVTHPFECHTLFHLPQASRKFSRATSLHDVVVDPRDRCPDLAGHEI